MGLSDSGTVPRGAHRSRVPALGGTALPVPEGGVVSVVNALGYQVADTWAVTTGADPAGLSTSHSRFAMGRISPRPGDVLLDDRRRPLLRLPADTSTGGHDTLVPACDQERYRALGANGWHANCAENRLAALAGHGLRPGRVPDALNLFMCVPVRPDGTLTLAPSEAAPGSEVVLEALQDLLLVVSACPQDLVPINSASGAPRHLDLYSD